MDRSKTREFVSENGSSEQVEVPGYGFQGNHISKDYP